MQINQGLTKCLVLFVAPLAGLSVSTSASLAATLASSEARVTIDNFSHNPSSIATLTDAKTVAISTNGQVNADANSSANFIADTFFPLTQANNSSLSKTNGQGREYFGLAQSFAQVIGYDFVVPGGTFSLDFESFLDLNTSIDFPQFESANAAGMISFLLFDSQTESLLDFFTLSANLETPGQSDFLYYDNSSHISFKQETSFSESFGGKKESATASVKGQYSRNFDSLTYLTLVEIKTNQANVKATPESSSIVALLFFCLIGVGYGIRSQASGSKSIQADGNL
ncbi:PEP-CTERM sorting domain-containing protein [Microseira sp. BLCC-F43]|jgi:hypothetical protein|uniref:PEP-CTERM sorting domain-containing protein n=1 Tax=Microseira sp. BLCC-F43 TaxID=3153602 RepID=UPI0035BA19EC